MIFRMEERKTMNYNQIIKKLLAGEEINALERAELENFDADSLISEKDSVIRERDQLKVEHQSIKRRQQLQEIAGRFNCSDPDFLDYLAARHQLDLNDEQAVNDFLAGMQKSSPHCFYSSIKSGGGEIPVISSAADGSAIHEQDRIGRIAASLAHVPGQQ